MSLDIATCQNPDAIYEVSLGTDEGCPCDKGFIMDVEGCKPKEECGCIYKTDTEAVYIEVRSLTL